MANIINSIQQPRVYNGDKNFIASDSDIAVNTSGGMLPDVETGYSELINAASNVLKSRQPIYQWKTKNKSFLTLYNDLYRMGIKRNKFFLRLYDKDLLLIDPYSPALPPELQLKILLECMINPWYFLREVARVPEDGMPIEVGGGTAYKIDRNNLASWYLFLNGIDHYQSKSRQRGKTVDCILRCNYAYHFGALATNMLFFNKDYQMAKTNLYRLKCQRDMLPTWMQMRTIIDDNGKVDRGQDSITAMRNPITGNTITVMPRATSKDAAVKLGRGATAAIQYYDEFDFIPFNIEIINAASFAYSRASENAKKNSSMYGRIYSSTPGDLDSRDGEAATEYISHMLKWDDSMFDLDIEELRKQACGPGRNRVVFVEHSWRQLKCSMKWYEDQCGLVSFNQEVILREIELQRIHGSNQSPFDRNDIMYIIQNKKAPIEKLDLSKNLCPFLIYEKLNRNYPYILAVDPSEGLTQDNNAATFINPYTLRPAVEFKSPYISQPQMVEMLCDFMDQFCPKCMIVVENNRGREAINCFLASRYKYNLYYDDGKLTSKIVSSTDPYGNLKKAAYERQAYGFYTSSNRSALYAILENLMKEGKDILIGEYIVDDICGLIRKTNGRVEAGPGKHDDNIMSYLIGLYIYYNADYSFLESFGIVRGASEPMQYKDSQDMSRDEKIKAIKNMLPGLPDYLQEAFNAVLQEKNTADEEFKYYQQIERAKQSSFTLPSQMTEDERQLQMRIGRSPDYTDQSFWRQYDESIMNTNYDDVEVDIDDFM